MANLKTKSVALLLNGDNTCKYVFVATHVSETEYKTLYNEMKLNEQKDIKEKEAVVEKIDLLIEEIKRLNSEIKLLKGEDEDEKVD